MGRDVDRVALAFGIGFVVLGVLFLLDRLDVWDLKPSYVLPVLLIAIGVAILLGARWKRPPEPPAT
ncbi:MAG TPA: DUF5668 domain-containing protein [Actinomycetota bacterium]|nr:DUF5668 domain-containing protein [Actinomycetota bacterium]